MKVVKYVCDVCGGDASLVDSVRVDVGMSSNGVDGMEIDYQQYEICSPCKSKFIQHIARTSQDYSIGNVLRAYVRQNTTLKKNDSGGS